MGLLNNDNYIDPFKGADYIDPGKNAEKLSSNVDREHAQREAYEQQRYAKQQQTPQRTPTPPQEPRHTPQQALVNRQTPISRTTRTRKSRIPIIIIAIAVLTIIAMNLVGTIVSHGGLDSIADRLDPNTEKYEQLSEQKTINETSGNLYSYGGMALTVTIKNMEVGPTDINGQPTVKVTYGCRNLSRRAIYPNAVADSIVTQNGIELRKAVVTGYNGNLDLASKKIKSGETSKKVSYHVLSDMQTPIAMQVSNFRHKNLVRSAFAFDGSNETLTRIDYSDVPEAPKVDKAAFVEDGRVEELNGTILHFRLDSLEIQQNDEDEPLMVARISWYLENTSTYETFSYHASVNARQGTETLDQDYLYGDDSSLILRAQADVLATSIYAYELDDERTSVKLTIEGDDTVLFEKDFEPSSGTVV